MPPVGNHLAGELERDKPITLEDSETLDRLEREVSRIIRATAPPRDYDPHWGSRGDWIVTTSATATYEVGDQSFHAVVDADQNADVTLRVWPAGNEIPTLYQPHYQRSGQLVTARSWPRPISILEGVERAKTKSGVITELMIIQNIVETLRCIQDANEERFGVRTFENLTYEQLRDLQKRCDPNLSTQPENPVYD